VKIIAIEVYAQTLTYAHGQYAMSGGRVARTQQATLVRIITDEGAEGWGEATPLAGTYLQAFAGGVRAALGELGPCLLGADPRDIAVIHQIMDDVLLGQNFAKSAVDIACWDLLGQTAGLPVSRLLGGVLAERFPLYEAVPLGPPGDMAGFVRQRRAGGIHQFQVKVGNDPFEDAERVRHVIDAAGPDATVIADANGGWTLPDAVIATRLLQELPVYLEQPCRETADCALLRPHNRLPLVLDESVVTPADLFEGKQAAGASSVNIKLGRVGGITAAAHLRDLARRLGMSVSLEDAWGGDVVTAAVSHLAASTHPRFLLTTSFFNDWVLEHVAGRNPRSADGTGSAPTAPGLGITVDTSLLGRPLQRVHA
jgi:L-alanine-DL-glutamate epimerase-like enolase superfamily enzyme